MRADSGVPAPPRSPRTVEPWPVGIALLLLAMISVSLAFSRVAAIHPDAVIAGDAFASTRAQERAMQSTRRAEANGWRLDARAHPTADGMRVQASMRDAAGRRIEPDRLIVEREHPSRGGFDARFETRAEGEAQIAEVPLPQSGRWTLWVIAERDGAALVERLDVMRGGR